MTEERSLEELVDEDSPITYGVVKPGPEDERGVLFVRGGDVVNGEILLHQLRTITKEVSIQYRRTLLRGGELLVSLVGNPGQVAIVPNSLKGANIARQVGLVRLRDNVSKEYVKYYLLSRNGQSALGAQSLGSVQQVINLKDLRRVKVPLPPLPEQRAIAGILGALDDKIELNRRMNRTLESMARAVFREWFVESEEVEGWDLVPLPEIFEVNPPRSLKKGDIAPYLDMANMPTQGHRGIEWRDRPFGSGTKFINGDTLLARITPCLENGKTAFVDFLEDDEVGWGSTEYIVLRPKPPLPVEYGYYLARSDELRNHAIVNMTGTSGRQRTPASCFDNYLVPVPPEDLAMEFGEFAKSVIDKVRANDEESRTLASLRDTLLPKLMRGEVRVKET